MAHRHILVFAVDDLQTVINSVTDATADDPVDLIISDGTYDVDNLVTKDWVHLMANSPGRNVHIRCHRPDGSQLCQYHETITYRSHTILQGLTITVKNGRYPVHNEFGGEAGRTFIREHIINCHIEHLGNWDVGGIPYADPWTGCGWGGFHAHGCGTNSGIHIEIDNSTLIGLQGGAALYAHNNADFTAPSRIIARNCILGTDPLACSIQLESLGSGVHDTLELYDCTAPGYIYYTSDNWQNGDYFPDDAQEWRIIGGNNSYDYFFNRVNVGTHTDYHFTDPFYTKLVGNSSNTVILRGRACKYDVHGFICLLTDSDDLTEFAGVALTDIAAHSSGYIQHAGVLTQYDVDLVGEVAIGDGLTVNASGQFTYSATDSLLTFRSLDTPWQIQTFTLGPTKFQPKLNHYLFVQEGEVSREIPYSESGTLKVIVNGIEFPFDPTGTDLVVVHG
jgi:hypothetical protein